MLVSSTFTFIKFFFHLYFLFFFFFNDTATTEIYTLSLHDALPILLEQILAKLESEFCASSNAGLFAQLKPLLSGEPTELSYAELGQRFGISEANVKVTVHRLRRRYRELLREEVANTVKSPDQIDDEIRK